MPSWEQRIGSWLALGWDGTFPSTLPPYAGYWQRELGRALDQHDMVAVRMPRQVGKTKALRAAGAATAALGESVIIAAPSLIQTGRVLMDEVHAEIGIVGPRLGMQKTKREGLTSRWNTGGKIFGLSLSGEAKVEGLTGGLLIVDEAHDISVESFEKVYPSVSQAIRSGTFRVIFTGIGSLHPSSLLAQAHRRMGAFNLHITPEEIVTADPSYAVVFDQFRATMTAAGYRRNIECEDMEAGLHQLYPVIPAWVEYEQVLANRAPVYHFGIDVGWKSDETVVTVLETKVNKANMVGEFRTGGESFGVQAALIHQFIDQWPYKQEHIAVETNGLGAGLYSALKDKYWRRVLGVNLTAELKTTLINEVALRFEQGRLGIKEEAWRVELATMQREYKGVDEKKVEYTHSDLHSSLLMAHAISAAGVTYEGGAQRDVAGMVGFGRA